MPSVVSVPLASVLSVPSATHTTIEIDSLFEGIDFYTIITRARFEELCQDSFRSTLEPVEKVLRDFKTDKDNAHEIVLVDGSTRIPRIAKLISDFFDGKEPHESINSDQAAAHGTAVQVVILSGDISDSGDISEEAQVLLLLDVAPLSLGIVTVNGVISALIKCNTTLPTTNYETFSTYADKQPAVLLQVHKDKCAYTKGIPLASRGVLRIEVIFNVDAAGALDVSISSKVTSKSTRITITIDKGRLLKEELNAPSVVLTIGAEDVMGVFKFHATPIREGRRLKEEINHAANCIEQYKSMFSRFYLPKCY